MDYNILFQKSLTGDIISNICAFLIISLFLFILQEKYICCYLSVGKIFENVFRIYDNAKKKKSVNPAVRELFTKD